MEEIEEMILELEKAPLKDLCGVHESIYMEHHHNAVKPYKLSALARIKIQFTSREFQVFRCQV